MAGTPPSPGGICPILERARLIATAVGSKSRALHKAGGLVICPRDIPGHWICRKTPTLHFARHKTLARTAETHWEQPSLGIQTRLFIFWGNQRKIELPPGILNVIFPLSHLLPLLRRRLWVSQTWGSRLEILESTYNIPFHPPRHPQPALSSCLCVLGASRGGCCRRLHPRRASLKPKALRVVTFGSKLQNLLLWGQCHARNAWWANEERKY